MSDESLISSVEISQELRERIEALKEFPNKYPERRVVVCAACRYGDLILMSPRHWDIPMYALLAHIKVGNKIPLKSEQGFVDNWGNFMTREEAYVVAEARGQIKYPEHGTGNGVLFSEMLY